MAITAIAVIVPSLPEIMLRGRRLSYVLVYEIMAAVRTSRGDYCEWVWMERCGGTVLTILHT